MSLLTTDITKVKRLSLKEVKLPAKVKPTQVERPPSTEEIAYSKIVANNPLIEELVERLDLVSIDTGERIKKVETREEIKPHPMEIDKPQLIALAQRIIEGGNGYTKEEVIKRIKEATNVNQERAGRGFIAMLQAGAIEQTRDLNIYHLFNSTPF
jgi:hypothetical protein